MAVFNVDSPISLLRLVTSVLVSIVYGKRLKSLDDELVKANRITAEGLYFCPLMSHSNNADALPAMKFLRGKSLRSVNAITTISSLV